MVPVTKGIAGMLPSVAGTAQTCSAFFQAQHSALIHPFISRTPKSPWHVLHAQMRRKTPCKGRRTLNAAACSWTGACG